MEGHLYLLPVPKDEIIEITFGTHLIPIAVGFQN